MTSDPDFVSKAIVEWWWHRRGNRHRFPPSRPVTGGSAAPYNPASDSAPAVAAGWEPERHRDGNTKANPAQRGGVTHVYSEEPQQRSNDRQLRYVADILHSGGDKPPSRSTMFAGGGGFLGGVLFRDSGERACCCTSGRDMPSTAWLRPPVRNETRQDLWSAVHESVRPLPNAFTSVLYGLRAGVIFPRSCSSRPNPLRNVAFSI